MYNFLCHYSYHAYFILSHKSEKRVTEWNKRLAFEVYLYTGGNPTSSLKMTESLKIFCVIILMHISFCPTNQKNVLQNEIKD